MRALVIGRGSMGRRRIRDLKALGVEVHSWDIADGVELDALVNIDMLVVSTPPLTHRRYGSGAPIFTEADVEAVPHPHFPSATPLFCEDIIRITAADNPRPIAYTLHVGQNIADWHPGAPSSYYAYQEETSPPREMLPFELIWLTRWLGPVTEARGLRFKGYVGAYAIRHESGALGTILIDALARPSVREMTFVGDGWQKHHDIRYTERAYFLEMRALVETLKGGPPWPYSQAEEAANLEVLHTIERSG